MSEQTISEYNKQALRYEEKWESYSQHTHQKFPDKLQTDEHDLLLDMSGGTGLLAQKPMNSNLYFRYLIVNDPSQGMLAIAQNRLPIKAAISFTSYRAGRLSFKKNYFDRIFCLNAFHPCKNQQQVLDIIHFILKPGGRLFLLDWNRAGFFKIVNQLIEWTTAENSKQEHCLNCGKC